MIKIKNIGDVVTLLSLTGGSVVIVSLAYEYGFASEAGIRLTDLSLGPEDFLKSAAAWAPPLFLAAVGIFVLETLSSYVEGGKTDAQIIEESSKPELTRKIRNSPDYVFLAFGIFITIALALSNEPTHLLTHQALFFAWMSIVGFLITRDSLRRKFPSHWLSVIWLFVGVILFVNGRGRYDAATSLFRSPLDSWEYISGQTESGKIIRRYSAVIIAMPKNSTSPQIIQSAEIRRITYGRLE